MTKPAFDSLRSVFPRWRRTKTLSLLAVVVAALLAVWGFFHGKPKQPTIGLITKTSTNPFFVKMTEGAVSSTRAHGAVLLTAAGKVDGDYETQVLAMRSMIGQGARAILITPNDAKAVVPEIAAARAKGVLVIALDSPTEPIDATDSLFGTNNFDAGKLIGAYGKVAMEGKPLRIATIDVFPGHQVGIQRHNGFLVGMGLAKANAKTAELLQPSEVVCMGDSYGEKDRARQAMLACLKDHSDINFVYTINEPAASGAREALNSVGSKDVPIVSIDGGCQGVRDAASGGILATSQQYPLTMATEGVAAAVEFIRSGKKPPPYFDTGVILVTDHDLKGIESRTTKFGLANCWG